MKQYIILNFTHGNGPFLRTTELALAINDLLEKRGHERFGIIVPLVYGDRQKAVMKENFDEVIRKNSGEILLDKNLGAFLESIFYGKKSYEESLKHLIKDHKNVEDKIQRYISAGLMAEDFNGNKVLIKKEDIAIEINRCPLISFGIKPSYYTNFAYLSEVFERSLKEKDIHIDKAILKRMVSYYSKLEKKQAICFIAEPATFTYLGKRPKRYDQEIYTPPNSNQSLSHHYFRGRKGAYVTVTGITDINKRIFKQMCNIGVKIYTNDPRLIPFSEKARPAVISDKNILFHFTRVGWGSAWLSMLTKTPLIALPYDPKDDPEVYFNNICIEKIGLGKVYAGQTMKELLKFGKEYKKNIKSIKDGLIAKYGMLNGVKYTAEKIINHYLNL